MPKIDPTKGPSGDGGGSELLTAGEYALGLVYFKRKQTKKGWDMLNTKWEVIDGPLKGRTTWLTLGCNLATQGAVNRWRILASNLEIVCEFEIGSTEEGTAEVGDRELKQLFVGRGTRMKIRNSTYGEYTNNDIESHIFRRLWSKRQLEEILAWEAAWKAKTGRFDAPPDSDVDDPLGAVTPAATADDGAPDWDSDIPFD